MLRLSDLGVGASWTYCDIGLKQVDKLLQVMVELFGIGKARERGEGYPVRRPVGTPRLAQMITDSLYSNLLL